MLEPEMTYAELAVKHIKESKGKNETDYVHPKNDIKDGFIIINYKKRGMVWKELMGEKIGMVVPEDWELTASKKGMVYQYEASAEKERMTLIYKEKTVIEDYSVQMSRYTENSKMPLTLLDSMEIPCENSLISCSFLQDQKDTFFGIFFCRMGEGTIQGIFSMHRYRKKPWKHIIPQMLGTIKFLTGDTMES